MKVKPLSRIVVEGMDGSGKTTLVNQLYEYLGPSRVEIVPGYNRIEVPKSPISTWWMEQLSINPFNRVVIHDRFFYPELVYGPVLRGKINAEQSTIDYVRSFLREHALLIYCRPPVGVIRKGVMAESQMLGVHAKFSHLLYEYDLVMSEEVPHMGKRFIRYDRTKDDALLRLMGYIREYLYA